MTYILADKSENTNDVHITKPQEVLDLKESYTIYVILLKRLKSAWINRKY